MKVTLYPRLLEGGGRFANPYITDFADALQRQGIEVANPPHRNPLFSLLLRPMDSDAYIFHWLENVPDYKYGPLQVVAALWLMLLVKLRGRTLVWFLHNRQPHDARHRRTKSLLMRLLMRHADLIVTHASEGVSLVRRQCPQAAGRTLFLHHPTKNRLDTVPQASPGEPAADLLVWGSISPYKGVPQFVRHVAEHPCGLRLRVVGRCTSDALWHELQRCATPDISLENRPLTFDELGQEMARARFVLVPYAPDSVLSSGILMDSLSFGARVIGPDVGSFRDYAAEPRLRVYTFSRFDDVARIVQTWPAPADREAYRSFLDQHSWTNFGRRFATLLRQARQGIPPDLQAADAHGVEKP